MYGQDISRPASLSVPLCYETVKYLVEGNSVTVAVSHEFVNEEPVMVNSYYGMQTNMTPVHADYHDVAFECL